MRIHTLPDRSTVRGQVVGEVRAEMARNRITINQLPQLIGKSQSYWSRRISGDFPLDVDDLAALAALLGVPASAFWRGADLTRGYAGARGLALVAERPAA